MSDESNTFNEQMMEMFIFETNQAIEQLEDILLQIEKESVMTEENINEIFRIMHTIKGSSSMMMITNVAKATHSLEDLFFFVREKQLQNVDLDATCDLVFNTIDFINQEISKIENKQQADGDEEPLVEQIRRALARLKNPGNAKEQEDTHELEMKETNENSEREDQGVTDQTVKKHFIEQTPEVLEKQRYIAKVHFEEDCKMENIRAFTVVRNLADHVDELHHNPIELFEDENSTKAIVENGFDLFFTTAEPYDNIFQILDTSLFVEKIQLEQVDSYDALVKQIEKAQQDEEMVQVETEDELIKEDPEEILQEKVNLQNVINVGKKKNIISVNVEKMDLLMDLVGEIVITESMVTKNPDLAGLELDSFNKAARQLRKLNNELQDIVMSIRMIEIGPTFHKMHRIVRDMNKKLNKKAELFISGEETEVDKNIIDALGEPLLHMIRNALDHGIETEEERIAKGKPTEGKIQLEAINTGGDVLIRITDDGKGLDRDQILQKAKRNLLLPKSEEDMTDKEVYNLILLPGFSTKEDVTEFSGRGVGMDVVQKSIDKIGGVIQIDSKMNEGTIINIKIPLTLAIIDGMKISVGQSIFTIPTTTIRESFKPEKKDIIKDTAGNEMILIRGECYPIVRLDQLFDMKGYVSELEKGILVVVESEEVSFCVFADDIIGEQQVVVKPIPAYLRQYNIKNSGIAGCAILGNADISLILDIAGIAEKI